MSEINLDDIEDIYDEITNEGSSGEEPDTDVEKPEPEPDGRDESASEDDSAGGADGDGGDEEDSPDPEPSADYRPAPSTWRAKAKAKWDAIDPDIREEILKREEDGLKGVNLLKEKANYGERLTNTISPYRPFLSSRGLNEEAVVKNALDLAYSLTHSDPQTKASILMGIAQQYGADMEVFKGDIPKIDPVKQELMSIKQQLYAQQNAAQQAEAAKVQQAIQEFMLETVEGKPRYPFFSNVEDEMTQIIPLVKKREPNLSYREVLAKAYDEAVWTNPETRQILMANKAKEEDAQRRERQKDVIARAEKAKKSNLKPKPGDKSKEPKPLGTIDQTLNETYDAIHA